MEIKVNRSRIASMQYAKLVTETINDFQIADNDRGYHGDEVPFLIELQRIKIANYSEDENDGLQTAIDKACEHYGVERCSMENVSSFKNYPMDYDLVLQILTLVYAHDDDAVYEITMHRCDFYESEDLKLVDTGGDYQADLGDAFEPCAYVNLSMDKLIEDMKLYHQVCVEHALETKVNSYIEQFKEHGVLEDRMEYDVVDLKNAYPELDDETAGALHKALSELP